MDGLLGNGGVRLKEAPLYIFPYLPLNVNQQYTETFSYHFLDTLFMLLLMEYKIHYFGFKKAGFQTDQNVLLDPSMYL